MIYEDHYVVVMLSYRPIQYTQQNINATYFFFSYFTKYSFEKLIKISYCGYIICCYSPVKLSPGKERLFNDPDKSQMQI